MNYWLMKSEPDDFSIDDLKGVEQEPWTGVRNYQARNFMRDQMKVGDKIFFYHSNCAEPAIVGIAKVASKPYDDPTQFDPRSKYFDPKSRTAAARWQLVDVGYVRHLKHPITLTLIKDHAESLGDFALTRRGNRLSVMPVEKAQWDAVLALETLKN